MNTANNLERKMPRAGAHRKRRVRGGPGQTRARRLARAGLGRRQLRQAHHLRDRRAVPAYTPGLQAAQSFQAVQAADLGGPDDNEHETAVESVMPEVSPKTGLSLRSTVTVPVASLVACIYIGVPLTLFTHDFADHRLLVTVVASALVFAAAFGGVLRVLRMTTPSATPPRAVARAPKPRALGRPSPRPFSYLDIEARDYPHFVEA
ncbi:MAG: hypothetical protein ABSG36_15825 [Acidimicrobiales bacterium]